MAWNAKKISVVAGALTLVAEAGLNNSIIMGLVYAGASGVATPMIVRGVVVAHDAEVARLAADRAKYAEARGERNLHGTAPGIEPGDADQKAMQTDFKAEDSPDMPRRIGPMLVARRAFLAGYEDDAASARQIVQDIDMMLKDDMRAFASFARRSERDPAWGRAHRGEIADLRTVDARLASLRALATK